MESINSQSETLDLHSGELTDLTNLTDLTENNDVGQFLNQKPIETLSLREKINFALTNRFPRVFVTILVGKFSKIENRWLAKLSIWIWQKFVDDLKLEESPKQEYTSLRACFTRKLKPGVRQVDHQENVVVSPCDAIVGMHGRVFGNKLYQTKGFPYALEDLIPDESVREKYQNGWYVTLRLKSSMYHRFHAPIDCEINDIEYISGDAWNVNPVALKAVDKLFCKNERAVVDLNVANSEEHITLVPVAAVLVASMKFHCLDDVLDLQYKGPNKLTCKQKLVKGQEIGFFQHGSTIIMFANEKFSLSSDVRFGQYIKMGQKLFIRNET